MCGSLLVKDKTDLRIIARHVHCTVGMWMCGSLLVKDKTDLRIIARHEQEGCEDHC